MKGKLEQNQSIMNKFCKTVKYKNIDRVKGAYSLEINNKSNKGYIEVWLTNEEQQIYDRKELTERLLAGVKAKKCKVVFFLSGQGNLFQGTEDLLIWNLGCV